MALEIERTDQRDARILGLSGDLDARSAAQLDRELHACLSDRRHSVLLDLAGLDAINGAGLRELVAASRRVAAEGGRLALCSLQEGVLEVVTVADMQDALPVLPDRARGLEWLESNIKVSRVANLAEALLRKRDEARPERPRHGPRGGAGARRGLAVHLLKGGDGEDETGR